MTMKRKIGYVVGGFLLLILGAAAYMLGPALLPPKSINVGIALNAKAPVTMPLQDSAGLATSLAEKMGPKGLVLVMVRSADWCPFCKAQLIRTNDIRAQITAQGYAIASLSYDKPETLAGFAKAKGLGYLMLSDQGSKMIDALGLRDPQYPPGNYAYGVPHPTILVLAPDGTVKAKYVSEDYRSRPMNDDVMAILGGIKS